MLLKYINANIIDIKFKINFYEEIKFDNNDIISIQIDYCWIFNEF